MREFTASVKGMVHRPAQDYPGLRLRALLLVPDGLGAGLDEGFLEEVGRLRCPFRGLLSPTVCVPPFLKLRVTSPLAAEISVSRQDNVSPTPNCQPERLPTSIMPPETIS